MILAERDARVMAEANAAVAQADAVAPGHAAVAEAEAANAQADLSSSEALIAHLKLAIEKLRRELYGTRSERKARLLDQMELQLEELEAAATEDELAAEQPRPKPRRYGRSSASGLHASHFPTICRASASSSRRRKAVRAADRQSCRNWGGHHRDAGGDPAAVESHPVC